MDDLPKKIIGFVVVFGVINLVLWGAQELYYRGDTQQVKEVETWLNSERRAIDALEAKINTSEAEIDRRERELDRLKTLGYISQYNAGVDGFNFLLSAYKRDVDTYNAKLTAYNAKVDEANALIKKSGTRWYLIPIPFGGGTKSKLPAR